MISLHQSGELVYHEIPSLISLKNHPQDLLANHHHDHVNVQTPNLVARKSHHSSSKPNLLASTTKHFKSENMLRKLVHREIERTRRKDQARLYASLGGLLPSELIKGKRSVSDRIDQAVSYIKQMQERVNDLTIKRDELKKIVDAPSVEESLMNAVPNTVSISSSNGKSVDIQINSCLIEDGFCLSGVLKALVEEGLHIINSTSKKINKRLLHCIQSEANATTLADPSMLLQRLTAVANYNHLGKISIKNTGFQGDDMHSSVHVAAKASRTIVNNVS